MDKENKQEQTSFQDVEQDDATNLQENHAGQMDEMSDSDKLSGDSDELTEENWKLKYDELNDMHLRLMAEFDNYRKRTIKEKAEIIRNGGESVLIALLPVVDDFERALNTINNSDSVEGLVEGVELIYTKFMDYLKRQGVEPIEAIGMPFDTEKFDAIAKIPAPSEDLKGKVVDATQTGYMLHDKVIRHSKVVVGE